MRGKGRNSKCPSTIMENGVTAKVVPSTLANLGRPKPSFIFIPRMSLKDYTHEIYSTRITAVHFNTIGGAPCLAVAGMKRAWIAGSIKLGRESNKSEKRLIAIECGFLRSPGIPQSPRQSRRPHRSFLRPSPLSLLAIDEEHQNRPLLGGLLFYGYTQPSNNPHIDTKFSPTVL